MLSNNNSIFMKLLNTTKTMFKESKHAGKIEISINNQNIPQNNNKGVNFEDAILRTGYGKFNILLFLSIIPVSWATNIDTANVSMILTPAECDLELTLLRKGILNAGTYAGMVSSSLIWGFIADVFGRKNVLVYGYLIDGICNILSGLSQNTWMLVGFKFISGFIVSGAYAATMSYAAEFHATKSRPQVLLRVALAASFGNIVNGVLALLVIPENWNIVIYNNSSGISFQYNSWRIFLSLCGLPSLIGAICLSFFPESPKFLMSKGRNEEALGVFKRIFSMNTGLPEDNYPVESLEYECMDNSINQGIEAVKSEKSHGGIRNGFSQMKPLLTKWYLSRLILVTLGQFCAYLSANTIRLWQPHVFSILSKNPNVTETFCTILDASHKETNETVNSFTCTNTFIHTNVYTNNIIVASSSIVIIFIAGFLVSHVNPKKLIIITIAGPFCFLFAMIWSTSTIMTLVFICLFVALMATTANLIIAITVNLFPTCLRTTAVSLVLMLGRIGAVTGSILFPVLLQYGCFISISSLASFVLLCFMLILFVPKPDESVK